MIEELLRIKSTIADEKKKINTTLSKFCLNVRMTIKQKNSSHRIIRSYSFRYNKYAQFFSEITILPECVFQDPHSVEARGGFEEQKEQLPPSSLGLKYNSIN